MEGNDTRDANRADVARGTVVALLGRGGAVIDVASLAVFSWCYGAATLGIYFALAGVVRVLAAAGEFGMTHALQRFVPAAKDEAEKAGILRIAVYSSALLSGGMALILTLMAPVASSLFNASEADAAHLTTIFALFIWTLPLTTLLEVLTAAVRATGQFGPEIRIRIFYEQILRLGCGLLFWALGLETFGLFLAGIVSLAVSVALAARLLTRFYDVDAAMKVAAGAKIKRRLMMYGSPMLPVNLFQMLHSELPVLILNVMLPGAAGAVAAGVYGTARKVVSALYLIRHSLEYVMAPLTAARAGTGLQSQLKDMIGFSTRIGLALMIPSATFLICVREDFLKIFQPDFMASASIILILSLFRVLQAATGPANAVVEMLGRYWEPLLYGFAGIIFTVIGQKLLIPLYGAEGAAIAAGAGISFTSFICFWRMSVRHRLWPYDRNMIRPVLYCTAMAAVQLAVDRLTMGFGVAVHALIEIALFLGIIYFLFKHGFVAADRAAWATKKGAAA